MPILCNYYVTYRCNASCAFCRFGDHARFRDAQPARTDDVLRNLAALRSLGVRFVDFTGGEPLLHPDIAVFTATAKQLGLRTSITTNTLLYPKHAERLAGTVDLLHFSLDHPDRETHDASRGVPCYDALLESIALASRLGEHPDLLFTVTNDNVSALPGAYALARRHGLLLLINPLFEDASDDPLTAGALDAVAAFASRPMTYLNPSFIDLRRDGGNRTAAPVCKAASRVIVISPANEILLPCYHQHVEAIPIGADLRTAYRNPRIGWHRERQGRHDFCEGCVINCYFEPSFAFPVDAYSIRAVPSKFRYGFNKYVRQPLSKMRGRGAAD